MSIPKGKNAGTYYVWFKTVGDAGSGESEPGVVAGQEFEELSTTYIIFITEQQW